MKPLKTVANKIQRSNSIFNLPISQSMQQFTIKDQHRCSTSYHAILGKYVIPIIELL